MEMMPGETLEATGGERTPLFPHTPQPQQQVNGYPPSLTRPSPLLCWAGGGEIAGVAMCNGEVNGIAEEVVGVEGTSVNVGSRFPGAHSKGVGCQGMTYEGLKIEGSENEGKGSQGMQIGGINEGIRSQENRIGVIESNEIGSQCQVTEGLRIMMDVVGMRAEKETRGREVWPNKEGTGAPRVVEDLSYQLENMDLTQLESSNYCGESQPPLVTKISSHVSQECVVNGGMSDCVTTDENSIKGITSRRLENVAEEVEGSVINVEGRHEEERYTDRERPGVRMGTGDVRQMWRMEGERDSVRGCNGDMQDGRDQGSIQREILSSYNSPNSCSSSEVPDSDNEPFNPDRDWRPCALGQPQSKDQPDSQDLYQPEQELNPFDFNLNNAVINVENNSQVQFGPKYEFLSGSAPTPGVNVTQGGGSPNHLGGDMAKDTPSNIHISIHTPPVHPTYHMSPQVLGTPGYPMASQGHPMVSPGHLLNPHPVSPHSPAVHTMSAPVSSPSPIPAPDPRYGTRPPSQLPLHSPHIQPSPTIAQTPPGHLPRGMSTGTIGMPTTPTPTNTICISKDSSMIYGPQIVINQTCFKDHKVPLESTPPGPSALESLLTEVQNKLSTVYIRQTRTSFLPWLKGHQVIPMTAFYTDSRILAVDSQGRQTRPSVNLVKDLMGKEETRFLVEGEPGMGKTLLALKLAIDWAEKKSLQAFKFVFLIYLRDFKGSLETYVKEELLPSHFEEKFRQVWEYCKEHEEEVLFILDGFDELEGGYEAAVKGDIGKLLNHQDFQKSKVVMTSRPNKLKIAVPRMVVKGFNEEQMFEFITKYFKLVNEDDNGTNLKRIIEKDYKYKKLAKRPLFCVLLCMLYGSDSVAKSKLPQKLSDMMFKIMLCLIKWNIKKVENVDENTEDFPPEYERLFLSFGKLCLQALETEKTRFSRKDIEGIENYEPLLHLGFLSNENDVDVTGAKEIWKPVHKIFLEYLAGLYMASHIKQEHKYCQECREFSKFYRHEHILKFVVGILGDRAHLALDGRKHQVLLQMKDQELLMLLRETRLTEVNCRAVAKLLDRRSATIYTSEVDFEGWSCVLGQKFKNLKTLEIVWRIKSNNPDQESSFSEASPQLYSDFFNALRSNTSITKISIRATLDGEPFSEKKIELFFSHLQRILSKENLRELEIKELKMRVSEHLRKAFEGATCNMDKRALESLEVVRLDMFLSDADLSVVCDRLKRFAPNLKELQLTGLEPGCNGFKSLVELMKKGKSLHKLCLSLNYEDLIGGTKLFMTKKENLTPSDMNTSRQQMPREATKRSKEAMRVQEPEPRPPQRPQQDPTRELSYLFQDHLHTGVKYTVKSRGYHFISGGGETKLALPLCISNQHESVFHLLFSALPDSYVQSLTLDYPGLYLNIMDLVCLGDAIRRAKHLTTLKLIDMKKVEKYMPVLLGLGQSQSLKTVKLESKEVVISDTAFQLACTALRHNTALRTLSLAHWEFNLQNKKLATQYLQDLLSSWKVRDLNLTNATLDISAGQATAPTLLPTIIIFPIPSPSHHWPNTKILRLSEVKIKDQLGQLQRGHLLLPMLRCFPNLTILDLSASDSNLTTLDDNNAYTFFKILGSNFKKLKELTLANWEFKFENYERTCGQIGNMVRSCGDLKVLKLNNVSEVRSGLSQLTPCRITFLHQLVNNLPRLAELSLCKYRIDQEELSRDMASRLGACFHDHWSSTANFQLKFFGLPESVESALHEALKKENVDVVVSQEYPLIFTVRRGYFLRT